MLFILIVSLNTGIPSCLLVAMVDCSRDDDSDEELGAYIYRTSRTAKLLREKETARNNELTTNNDANITRPKRKSPHEVENNMYS